MRTQERHSQLLLQSLPAKVPLCQSPPVAAVADDNADPPPWASVAGRQAGVHPASTAFTPGGLSQTGMKGGPQEGGLPLGTSHLTEKPEAS